MYPRRHPLPELGVGLAHDEANSLTTTATWASISLLPLMISNERAMRREARISYHNDLMYFSSVYVLRLIFNSPVISFPVEE